jgi:hypothetical protein
MQGMQGLFTIEDWPGINSSSPNALSTDSAILNNAIQNNIIATPADIEAAIAAKIADNTIANQADITAAMTPVNITSQLTWSPDYFWTNKTAIKLGRQIFIVGIIRFVSIPANTLERFPAGGNLPVNDYFPNSDGSYAVLVENLPQKWNSVYIIGDFSTNKPENTLVKNGEMVMTISGDKLIGHTQKNVNSQTNYFSFTLNYFTS